jgi:hypothetical protein
MMTQKHRGSFTPATRELELNPYRTDIADARVFHHEMGHARTYFPDDAEKELMQELLGARRFLKGKSHDAREFYLKDDPVEALARSLQETAKINSPEAYWGNYDQVFGLLGEEVNRQAGLKVAEKSTDLFTRYGKEKWGRGPSGQGEGSLWDLPEDAVKRFNESYGGNKLNYDGPWEMMPGQQPLHTMTPHEGPLQGVTFGLRKDDFTKEEILERLLEKSREFGKEGLFRDFLKKGGW